MRRPHPRYTILSLMVVVLLASLAMTFIVARREQRLRAIAVQTALAEYQNATLTREVAEIAVVEYTTAMAAQQDPGGEIALAKSDAERAADRSAYARVMRSYVKQRTIQELRDDLERARAVERARKAEYDRLKAIATGLFW